jgi:hypothetical protein
MPNSDTKYGTFNKVTKTLTQITNGVKKTALFADVNSAKSHFFTDAALTVMDECCTNLQWALVTDELNENTKLKYTMAFGTKGGNIAEADDWAGQFNSRKTALIASGGWANNAYSGEEVDSHLF